MLTHLTIYYILYLFLSASVPKNRLTTPFLIIFLSKKRLSTVSFHNFFLQITQIMIYLVVKNAYSFSSSSLDG